jgi:hypothetical protein
MRAGLVAPPESFEALAQGVVRIRRRWIELEQLLERGPRGLMLAGVEVRPPERFEDRRLAGLGPVGALEDDRRLRVVPPVQQRLPTLQQFVGRLLGRLGFGFGARLRLVHLPDGGMEARGMPPGRSVLSPLGMPPGRQT